MVWRIVPSAFLVWKKLNPHMDAYQRTMRDLYVAGKKRLEISNDLSGQRPGDIKMIWHMSCMSRQAIVSHASSIRASMGGERPAIRSHLSPLVILLLWYLSHRADCSHQIGHQSFISTPSRDRPTRTLELL